jgi:hypothetical protein
MEPCGLVSKERRRHAEASLFEDRARKNACAVRDFQYAQSEMRHQRAGLSPGNRARERGCAELARNLHAVPEKIRQGHEVVVEQDHPLLAIMKPAQRPGRLLSESIAIARLLALT